MNKEPHEKIEIFRNWLHEQITLIEKMENEKDNNSYEAPHDIMLLQGKRRVIERLSQTMPSYVAIFELQPFINKPPFTRCLGMTRGYRNMITYELEEHRAKKEAGELNHDTLIHSRTLGEYSMLCDIERKLLSLDKLLLLK